MLPNFKGHVAVIVGENQQPFFLTLMIQIFHLSATQLTAGTWDLHTTFHKEENHEKTLHVCILFGFEPLVFQRSMCSPRHCNHCNRSFLDSHILKPLGLSRAIYPNGSMYMLNLNLYTCSWFCVATVAISIFMDPMGTKHASSLLFLTAVQAVQKV